MNNTGIELKLPHFFMRLVEEEDAAFILSLRTDEALARYLHKTVPDVEAQKNWIRNYKKREQEGKEYYFIAESYEGEKLGLTRLYDLKEDSFVVGSWIFKRDIDSSIAILADLATRDFAFETLGLKICYFDTRKDNKSVLRYHYMFKPKLIKEVGPDLFFQLDYPTYQLNKQKILKIFTYGAE